MYKGYFLLILCLALVIPVAASVPNVIVVYPCSAYSANSPSGWGQLSLVTSPGGASLAVDGSPWTDPYSTSCYGMGSYYVCNAGATLTSTPAFGNLSTGTHKILISMNGYYNETIGVTICNQMQTYVNLNLPAVITTTPTPTSTTSGVIIINPNLKQVDLTTTAATTTATPTVSVAATSSGTSPTAQPTSSATTSSPSSGSDQSGSSAGSSSSQSSASTASASSNTGALSVTTTPSGAAIYIDGVQRGIAPATIPGLSPGDHTLLLKLDGYSDLTVPVTITAGETQAFTTSLSPLAQGQSAAAANASATTTPGFAAVVALAALAGAVLIMRKSR